MGAVFGSGGDDKPKDDKELDRELEEEQETQQELVARLRTYGPVQLQAPGIRRK